MNYKHLSIVAMITFLLASLVGCSPGAATAGKADGKGTVQLLNVSYDPTRELYEAYNKSFAEYWKKKTGQQVTIKQSHGGSGKQARAVMDGLQADIVTLALAYDIDSIAQRGLLNPSWQKQYPSNSSPYTSTIVFVVRKGNPKGIKDWNDLIKPGVSVITPNPKTSGGARWNYLAAWGYALKHNNNDENKAKDFMAKLFKNVPVLDTGARGSTTTFTERGIGDVLISWESDALLAVNKLGKGRFEIVYPPESILAEPPVALVDKVVDKHGTRKVADAYLQYMYSKEGQEIAAQNYYRPLDPSVAAKYKQQFPSMNLFTVNQLFSSWSIAQKKHFDDGGTFDEIYKPQ
jgi:sulfate/thiosulfate transport system substrate-binding protein